MRYAIIETGKVTNVVEASAEYAATQGWVVAPADVSTGWLYSGGNFSEPAPEPEAVPPIISMMQAELALIAAGKLAAVRAVVAGADEATKSYFNRAYEIHRDHPVTAALGSEAGIDSAAMDALFIAAKKIK